MSLLAPARGMPALPAKGGFSRPSFIRNPGSHLGLISPRSLAYSICWDRLSLSFIAPFFTPSQFHKRFNLFIIRSTASLIGTEGGDSYGNSKRSSVGRTIVQSHEPWDPTVSEANEEAQAMPVESVRLQWKSTVLAHIQRIRYVQIYILGFKATTLFDGASNHSSKIHEKGLLKR